MSPRTYVRSLQNWKHSIQYPPSPFLKGELIQEKHCVDDQFAWDFNVIFFLFQKKKKKLGVLGREGFPTWTRCG
jgi:hypothetical protein